MILEIAVGFFAMSEAIGVCEAAVVVVVACLLFACLLSLSLLLLSVCLSVCLFVCCLLLLMSSCRRFSYDYD